VITSCLTSVASDSDHPDQLSQPVEVGGVAGVQVEVVSVGGRRDQQIGDLTRPHRQRPGGQRQQRRVAEMISRSANLLRGCGPLRTAAAATSP